MAIPVPRPSRTDQTPDEPAATLRETLDALLEFTGATAGWIGLLRPDGRLSFPARAGAFSEAWLTLQQGQTAVWGFEVCEGPTLLNDPPALPILGDPPLQNLLSCRLRRGTKPAGQLVLANKPNGFTSHDATALQTTAHLLSGQLLRQAEVAPPPLSAALLRRALDHAPEGILIVDHTGNLVFANATWGRWTGYAAEELCDRPPPFPFWVSHAELAALREPRPLLPDTLLSGQGAGVRGPPGSGGRRGRLPFRHRNHSLFWCQVETTTEEIAGQPVTVAFLRRLPAGHGAPDARRAARATVSPRVPLAPPARARARTAGGALSVRTLAEKLPFSVGSQGMVNSREAQGMALLLRPGGVVEFWDEQWEVLTGLSREDLAGVSGELFLDWLFPRQRDRNFVADLFHQPGRRGAQALLEVMGRHGHRSFLCTFLPVPASGPREQGSATGQGTKAPIPDPRSPVTAPWLVVVWDPALRPEASSAR